MLSSFTIHIHRTGREGPGASVKLLDLSEPESFSLKTGTLGAEGLVYHLAGMDRALGTMPQSHINWQCWYTPILPALAKQRQKDQEFKASLGYMRP